MTIAIAQLGDIGLRKRLESHVVYNRVELVDKHYLVKCVSASKDRGNYGMNNFEGEIDLDDITPITRSGINYAAIVDVSAALE